MLFLQLDLSPILSMRLYYPYCVLPVLHHLHLVFLGLLSFRAISHFVSFTFVTWFSTAAASVSLSSSLLEAQASHQTKNRIVDWWQSKQHEIKYNNEKVDVVVCRKKTYHRTFSFVWSVALAYSWTFFFGDKNFVV